jgi:lipocalin
MTTATTLLTVLVALCVATTAAMPMNKKLTSEPPTVKSLNVSAYLGKWYQYYQDLFDESTFQPKSYCATATYGLDTQRGPGYVSVFNWEHYGAVDGPIHNITGYAYRKDANTYPGRLSVVLFGGAPFPAPYWIMKLGPMTADGQYAYSLISDQFRLSLFVIVRDVATFEAKYKSQALAELKELGFTSFVDEPQKVVQTGCTYN